MAIKTYKAKVKLSNGAAQDVTVQADSQSNAKAMLEADYGKGSIISFPSEVR
jgi:hypothetical protein